MTDLTTTRPSFDPAAGAVPVAAPTTPAQEPTLITEQQVMFSTAAVVALPPARTHRWTDVFASFAAALRKAAGPPEPVRRHHSERYAYLQDA